MIIITDLLAIDGWACDTAAGDKPPRETLLEKTPSNFNSNPKF